MNRSIGLATLSMAISAACASTLAVHITSGHYVSAVIVAIAGTVNAFNAVRLFRLAANTKEKEHGLHRRPGSQVRVGATGGADPAGGSGGNASAHAGGAAESTEPTCREITGADTGLVIGEVEAFRYWDVVGDYLVSGMGAVWLPGHPMTGKGVDLDNTSGVHAFKTYADACGYGGRTRESGVIGKVRLWGIIAEHAIGYRAEYAKPLKILKGIGSADTDAIKARYDIEGGSK